MAGGARWGTSWRAGVEAAAPEVNGMSAKREVQKEVVEVATGGKGMTAQQKGRRSQGGRGQGHTGRCGGSGAEVGIGGGRTAGHSIVAAGATAGRGEGDRHVLRVEGNSWRAFGVFA
eukprot:307907-Pelagomonas_calceolata.AAC.2